MIIPWMLYDIPWKIKFGTHFTDIKEHFCPSHFLDRNLHCVSNYAWNPRILYLGKRGSGTLKEKKLLN